MNKFKFFAISTAAVCVGTVGIAGATASHNNDNSNDNRCVDFKNTSLLEGTQDGKKFWQNCDHKQKDETPPPSSLPAPAPPVAPVPAPQPTPTPTEPTPPVTPETPVTTPATVSTPTEDVAAPAEDTPATDLGDDWGK